jgi:hypothetical protein
MELGVKYDIPRHANFSIFLLLRPRNFILCIPPGFKQCKFVRSTRGIIVLCKGSPFTRVSTLNLLRIL